MHKLTTLYLVCLMTLAGASHASEAQAEDTDSDIEQSDSDSGFRAGVFLGWNYLSSENELGNSVFNDQVPNSGFLLGLRGSYLILDSISPDSDLNPQLNIEVEGKYTFSSTDGGVNGRESVSSPVLGWRTHLVLDLFPDKKLVPFALLGFGGETVFGANTYMTTPDTDIASYLGGGVRYPITDQIDFRGDLRFGLTASRGDGVSPLVELHFGLSYNFGSGVSEVKSEVEDKEPQDNDKPLPDTDHDGIPDVDDSCPQLPENLNGIDDTDGCPEEDTDNDGLLGSKDLCPEAAEDIDGFEDDDGCPDADNDGDGNPDVVDQCPGKPETKNGYQDDDGCPDDVPAAVQKFTGSIRGIVFKTGSARILKKSKNTLVEAFQVLSDNPTIRIEISGHTDDKGKGEANRTLSRKRADYVKWFLVDRGIGADRIETVGHGPDKPLGDNKTADGRQLNRRIEFRLLPAAVSSEVDPAASGVSPAPAPKAAPKGSAKMKKKPAVGKRKRKATGKKSK